MLRLLATAIAVERILFAFGSPSVPMDTIYAPDTFVAVDSEPNGIYNDADVEAALAACVSAAPRGGCEIVLEAQTYTDVQIEVPHYVRTFRGHGDDSVLKGPASPSGEAIVLREPRDSGWPTVFRDFKVDGNKQNLTSAPGDHNCIRVEDPTSSQLSGGRIENVTCESVAEEGFFIEDAPNWTIVNNTLRYLGCYDETGTSEDPWTPNGLDADVMRCGAWAAGEADESNQPGRVTNGIGIEVFRNSDNVYISGNLIEYYTKIGIQGIDSDSAAENSYPANGTVKNNTIRWGQTGIAMVRTNGWTVEGNMITDMDPPWSFGAEGRGITCSFAGRGNVFRSNSISRTGASGLDIGCGCGLGIGATEPHTCGVVADANTIDDACRVYTTNTASVKANAQSWVNLDPFVSGITLSDNVATGSNCTSGVLVVGYSDVVVSGGAYEGGSTYGLRATDGDGLTVDASVFLGSGTGTGISIESTVSNCTVTGSPSGTWSTVEDNQCS